MNMLLGPNLAGKTTTRHPRSEKDFALRPLHHACEQGMAYARLGPSGLATTLTSSNALPFAAAMTRGYSASGMDWSLLAAAGVLTLIPVPGRC